VADFSLLAGVRFSELISRVSKCFACRRLRSKVQRSLFKATVRVLCERCTVCLVLAN